MYYSISEINETLHNPRIASILLILLGLFVNLIGAGRGGRTPTTLRSADFESAASASSAIPALGWESAFKVSHRVWVGRYSEPTKSAGRELANEDSRHITQAPNPRRIFDLVACCGPSSAPAIQIGTRFPTGFCGQLPKFSRKKGADLAQAPCDN